MKGNKFWIFGFVLLSVIILTILLVSAAANAPTALIFSQNDTANYDNDGTVFLNWTAATQGANNYDILINVSQTKSLTNQLNVSATGFIFTNVTEGNYSFVVQTENATAKANSTANVWMVVDRTVPALAYSAVGTPADGATAAAHWILVNVTATDINNVSSKLNFSLYNSSGLINSTIFDYPANGMQTINWTVLLNSAYTFNVTANDSATNENSTASRTVYVTKAGLSTPTALIFGVNTTANYDKDGTVFLNWTNVADPGSSKNKTYVIFISVGSGLPFKVAANDSASGYTFTNTTNANYTFIVQAQNLTAGLQANTTANVTWMIIDTTNPVPSASCSPATVDSGATFPCECSVSDATSGVSSSSSSSTSGSITSTSATGTFTYTCSVVDNAGNSASSDATYSVTQTPGSPSGSGSGGGAITWVTQTVATEIFEQGYTAQLGSKNRIKVQVASEDHYIGVVSVSATEAVIQISSDPVQVTLSAGEDAKVDVDDDSFYDVYVLLNSIINNKANVTVQKIHEAVPEGESGVATTGELEGETTPAEEGASLLWLWILIGVVVVVAIGWGIGKKKK